MSKCFVCGGELRPLMVKDGFNYQRCIRCKNEEILPQPSNEVLDNIYSKEYYVNWGVDKQNDLIRELKQMTFSERLATLDQFLSKGDKILDCGCATGFFLELVKEKGFDPYGIEISAYGAFECKRKFGQDNIHHGIIETFKSNVLFNAVFMTDYIEHVREPGTVIRMANKFLNENGKIVLTTPKADSFSRKIFGRYWPHYKTEHLFYFNTRSITQLLSTEGFKDIQILNAPKYLSIQYVLNHLIAYRIPVVSDLSKLLNWGLPAALKNKVYKFSFGEMVVVASKG